MDIKVTADDLLKWARYFDEIPQRTPRILANTINFVGNSVLDEVSQYIAGQADLDPEDVKRAINVREATPDDLNWEMDASTIAPPSLNWSRPWGTPQDADPNTFDSDTLVKIVTMGDELVCEKCKEASENSPYTLAEAEQMNAYGNGLVHPNAVLAGSTFVSYGATHEMVSGVFSGPAVRIHTDTNITTIGPNHPMLTRRGFVKASELTERDQILYDCWAVGHSVAFPNFKDVPMVEDAFNALLPFSSGTRRACTGDNFHGDGVFCEGEIEIIKPVRQLLPVLDGSGIEQFSEFYFVDPDVLLQREPGDRPGFFNISTVGLPSSSSMGTSDLLPPRSFRHSRPFDAFLFGLTAERDVASFQYAGDNRTAGFAFLCDANHTISAFVEANNSRFRWDRVLDVHRVSFNGLAFDATTETGLYNSDGYIVHNCRCVMAPFYSYRKLPVVFAQRGDVGPQMVTLKQLSRTVKDQLRVELSVIKDAAASLPNQGLWFWE